MLNSDSRTLTPFSTIGPKEGSDQPDPAFQVTLTDDDAMNPCNISLLHKWIIVNVISQGALCVACASSTAAFTEVSLEQEFNVSHEISILSISLYVVGLGMGPLLAGPLSEVYGRNIIYQVSYILFFVFSWPVAFAKQISVFLIFRFVTGLCGAAFLSVAGGSVSDLFTKDKVASPMAFYTIFPFLGPVIGPLLSGFMNQHIYWRWTYYLIIIWSFVMTITLFIFVPETYAPVILRRKAERLRKETGELRYWTEYDAAAKNLGRAILFSLKTPFQLLLTERMALFLNIWTSLMLGILYLAFQAFPIIFMDLHGFSVESTGMSFLGIGIGMVIAWVTQPLWNRRFAKIKERYAGSPPPEVHLDMGKLAGILVAISLFWLAFTSYRQVHWIVPIIASVPFGSGTMLAFNSVFTYLVTAYRPVAASAMASNSAMRSTFAAVFPLFAQPMYMKLGTVGATALLGGLATLMAPLPFIFSRIGGRLRTKSRFAA
ncbi:MFS general substrate transporter [Amanita muscaria]